MEAASLDFFEKMTQDDIIQAIANPAPESTWYNSLFGDIFSGKTQYVQMEELHIPTTGQVNELPVADSAMQGMDYQPTEEIADYDLEMLNRFGTTLAENEQGLGDLEKFASYLFFSQIF